MWQVFRSTLHSKLSAKQTPKISSPVSQIQRPDPSGRVRFGDVQDLDSLFIANECVAKLSLHGFGSGRQFVSQHRGDLGVFGVFQRDNDQAGVAADVGVRADDGNVE